MKKRMLVWMLSFVLVLSMLSLTLAQETKPAGPPPVVKEMVAKAKAAIKVVPAADVKAAIDKKETAVILDVRDPGEYAAGHLPGAINVSRGTLELNIWNNPGIHGDSRPHTLRHRPEARWISASAGVYLPLTWKNFGAIK